MKKVHMCIRYTSHEPIAQVQLSKLCDVNLKPIGRQQQARGTSKHNPIPM